MTPKNPFQKVIDNPGENKMVAHEKIVAIYLREKDKAMQLYGNYQIKKVNWLYKMATDAQKSIDKHFTK